MCFLWPGCAFCWWLPSSWPNSCYVGRRWGRVSASFAPPSLLTLGPLGLYLLVCPCLRLRINGRHSRARTSFHKDQRDGLSCCSCTMTNCMAEKVGPEYALLDHIMPILDEHLTTLFVVAIIVVATICLRLRWWPQNSLPDIESWLEDEKPMFELPPPLPELASEFSHPLTQVLFQQTGIPTSGDLAQREYLNDSDLVQCPFPLPVPNSGDLAAMAPPCPVEEQRHPWRRHSYPKPQSFEGNLSQHQREAMIMGDAVHFFRDEKAGKLWRRRTLEFGLAR